MDSTLREQERLLERPPAQVSLDDIVAILSSTVFHPLGCWVFAMYYLLREYGGLTGFSDGSISIEIVVGVAYALFVELGHLLVYANSRWVSGVPRSSLNGVVVITGGATGLGEKIAAVLALKNIETVILDTKEPRSRIPHSTFIKCDVAIKEEIDRAAKSIDKPVSALINNAGIVPVKGTILELDPDTIRRTIDVNLMSQFWTVKAFVPAMIERQYGHIVTVSSVIGSVGPAKLSAYAASKGALNTFHDSLTHEVQKHGVRTLLVAPGQLDTSMFRGVRTPSSFVSPISSSVALAQRIVDALEKGQCGEINTPIYTSLIGLTKVLPKSIVEIVRAAFKMDEAMNTFVGNGNI